MLLLSAVLACGMILATDRIGRRLDRRRPYLLDMAVAALLFWAFVWLSPQIYYAYYRLIIPGLPAQCVVQAPPGPIAILQLLTFTAKTTLADHGQAALGWAMIVASRWRR